MNQKQQNSGRILAWTNAVADFLIKILGTTHPDLFIYFIWHMLNCPHCFSGAKNCCTLFKTVTEPRGQTNEINDAMS